MDARPQFEALAPVIRVPQPDGSVLVRSGKPQIYAADMSVSEAAKFLGLSVRHVESQCSAGLFKSAYKPGGLPRSRWRISRSEVISRRTPPSE
ncbi:MAG: helix-turn-helix domain-containing protein [Planctomycetaceae bacterium]|nr:helix-turn-helix domain-containing protein [Planctomycetaceae bacterium]